MTKPSDEQSTPQDFFNGVNKIFPFTLDVCASEANHKCERYFTKEQDGLKQSWAGETCWLNPPYSDPMPWAAKALDAALNHHATVSMLIRGDTGTNMFHNYIRHASMLYFVEQRLRFNNVKGTPNFATILAVFREGRIKPTINGMNRKGQITW